MSTDVRNYRFWQQSSTSNGVRRGRWIATLLDNTGELTARGVLFLFGTSTAMVCYVLSCSLG